MSIEPWLQRHLESTGRWDSDGVHRRATSRRCPACGARVIVGLDDTVCAGPATVDPTPLTALGEAVARLGGTSTYRLALERGSLVLDYRSQFDIAGKPAGTEPRTWDVVADHTCAGPTYPRTHTAIPQPRRIQETEHVPF